MKKILILALIFIVTLSAQVSIPTGLKATVNNGTVTLTWNKNPEIDVFNYHVYSDIGYDYNYIGSDYLKHIVKAKYITKPVHLYWIQAVNRDKIRSKTTNAITVEIKAPIYPDSPHYSDDLLLRMDRIGGAKLVIAPPNDNYKIREIGNIIEIPNNKVLMVYTLQRMIGGSPEEFIYYSKANKDDLKNWTAPVLINTDRELEDPFIELRGGLYYVYAEDKSGEPNKIFEISRHSSPDLVNWTFDGIMLRPGNTGDWDGLANYSPYKYYEANHNELWFDGRNMPNPPHVESIGFANWSGSKYDKSLKNPIITINKFDYLNNVGITELLHIKDKYLMITSGLWHHQQTDQDWIAGLAVSTDRINWEPTREKPFLAPGGRVESISTYYSDKWELVYQLSAGGPLYLGYPIDDNPPDPPDSDKQKLKDARELINDALDLIKAVENNL